MKQKRSSAIPAIALLASVSTTAFLAGSVNAQPEFELEEELEEEIEQDLEDELDEEIEDELEDEFDDELEDQFEDEFEDEFDDFDEFEGDDDPFDDDEDFEDEDFEDDDFEDEDLEDEDFDVDEDDDDEPDDEDIDDFELEDELDNDDEELEELEDPEDEESDEEDDEDEDEDQDQDEEGELEEENPEDDEFDLEEVEDERDLEASLSATTEIVFVDRDPEEFDVAGGEWLVLSSEDQIFELQDRGFAIRSSESVGLLDQFMVRAEPPVGVDLLASRDLLLEVIPPDQIDYNHLYQPQARFRRKTDGSQPLAAMPLLPEQQGAKPSIGLIDTAVVRQSKVFDSANIVARDFVDSTNKRPSQHGTAIASILVGKSEGFRGLLPDAQLYAASVFEILPGRGSTATTASLVRALQWMVENKVPVVNMSLTGPRNAILQRAITAARAKNVLVVAAIGNDGPAAKPLFPAAYEGVVSVTAIDAQRRVFRNANRGAYLDFSAPGVGILHATADGSLGKSTGTSIAAPFAAVAISLSDRQTGFVRQETLQTLADGALDLGAPGFDPIYGHGLIRPPR